MITFKEYLGENTPEAEHQQYLESILYEYFENSLDEEIVGDHDEKNHIIQSDTEGNAGDVGSDFPQKVGKGGKTVFQKHVLRHLHNIVGKISKSGIYPKTAPPKGTVPTDQRNAKIVRDLFAKHTDKNGVLNRDTLKDEIKQSENNLKSVGIRTNFTDKSVKTDTMNKEATKTSKGSIVAPSLKLPGNSSVVVSDPKGHGDESDFKHTAQNLCPGSTESCGGHCVTSGEHENVHDPKTGGCFVQPDMNQYEHAARKRHTVANLLATRHDDHELDGGSQTGPHVARDTIHTIVGHHLRTLEDAESKTRNDRDIHGEDHPETRVITRPNTTSEATGHTENEIINQLSNHAKHGVTHESVRYTSTGDVLPGEGTKRSLATFSNKGPGFIKNAITGTYKTIKDHIKRAHTAIKALKNGMNTYVVANAARRFKDSKENQDMGKVRAVMQWRHMHNPTKTSDDEYKTDHQFFSNLADGQKRGATRWFDHSGNRVEHSGLANHATHVDATGKLWSSQMTHRVPGRKSENGTPTDDRYDDNSHVEKVKEQKQKHANGEKIDHSVLGVDGHPVREDGSNLPLTHKDYVDPVSGKKVGNTYLANKVGFVTKHIASIGHDVDENTDHHGVMHLDAPFDLKTGKHREVVGDYTKDDRAKGKEVFAQSGGTTHGFLNTIKKAKSNILEPKRVIPIMPDKRVSDAKEFISKLK